MNKSAKLSQCGTIIQHMRRFGSITGLEAMKRYGIMRPGARLDEIDDFLPLKNQWVKSNGKRFKRYRIAKNR